MNAYIFQFNYKTYENGPTHKGSMIAHGNDIDHARRSVRERLAADAIAWQWKWTSVTLLNNKNNNTTVIPYEHLITP